jgi:predicted ArsR family transcriptional regulator
MPEPQAGSATHAVGPHSGRAEGGTPGEPHPNGTGANGVGANGTGANGVGTNGASASTLRRSILLHLRQAGPTSPDGLAAALGASRTGVLQQLHALEAANLVAHSTERHGVGRPRHLYDVTPDAQGLFPADYDGLAAGLLAAIVEVGGSDLVEEVFAARRRQIGARMQESVASHLGPDARLIDRVRELAVIQDEAGYLAEWFVGDDGALRLRENNCAIHHIAASHQAACDAELALFREVLGADVARETHIASGDRCCTYRIGSPRD